MHGSSRRALVLPSSGCCTGRCFATPPSCISSFVATASGKDNLISFVGSFLLLAQVPYASILVTYVFLLVIGIGVIALRLRSGFPALLAMVGLIWLFDALCLEGTSLWPFPFAQTRRCAPGLGRRFRAERAAWPDARRLRHGAGGRRLLAPTVTRRQVPSRRSCWLVPAGILLEAVRTGGLHLLAVGIADFAAYRAGNDTIYYAYGVCAAMVYMALAALLHLAMPLACPLADQHPGLPDAGLLRGRQRGPAAAAGPSRSRAAPASRSCPRSCCRRSGSARCSG